MVKVRSIIFQCRINSRGLLLLANIFFELIFELIAQNFRTKRIIADFELKILNQGYDDET
jgi:hypothetical protein